MDIVQYEEKRLLNIEAAAQLLIDARSIEEVAEVRNYAEAVRLVAKQAKAGLQVQNEAAELKLRAERRAGEMLAVIERTSGGNASSFLEKTSYQNAIEKADIVRSTAHNWQRIAAIPEQEFEHHLETTKETHKELTTAGTVRLAKEIERTQIRNTIIENGKGYTDIQAHYEIYHDDGLNYLTTRQPPNSVDFIITDPPYPEKYLELYEQLAIVSARTLKNGGSLLVMCGQSYLPEIMALMTAHLKYQWTLAYLTPGGQAVQLWQRKVNTFWKPILWFVNGDYQGDWIGDVIKSAVNDNDKRFHEWGQSVSGMSDLVNRFVNPEQLIIDPFCGAGTTGIAALQSHCQFIGIDNNLEQVLIARGRMYEASN